MSNPRMDVVSYLADAAMNGMVEAGVEDMTPAEVLSAAFTTCKKVMSGVLENSAPSNLEYNKQIMLDCLSELMAVIHPVIH